MRERNINIKIQGHIEYEEKNRREEKEVDGL